MTADRCGRYRRDCPSRGSSASFKPGRGGRVFPGPISMSSARRCATLAFAILVLLAPPAQAAPEALFDLDSPAPAPADADRRAIELGVRFTTAARFRADGVAFYRAPESPIADGRVRIWKGYEEVASGTADSTSRSGWVRVAFTAGPVMLEPNTEYVASYSAPEGGYASTPNYFSRPLDPPGTALRAPTAAGVYLYQYFLSPVYSWEDSNYWVTPYGEPSAPTEPTEPPAEGPWALFDATYAGRQPGDLGRRARRGRHPLQRLRRLRGQGDPCLPRPADARDPRLPVRRDRHGRGLRRGDRRGWRARA